MFGRTIAPGDPVESKTQLALSLVTSKFRNYYLGSLGTGIKIKETFASWEVGMGLLSDRVPQGTIVLILPETRKIISGYITQLW